MSFKLKKSLSSIFLIGILVIFVFVSAGSVLADEKRESSLREQTAVDVNHMDTIDKIWEYIGNHVRPDIFASLHIDREEDLNGVIVLSFTEEIEEETKEEIESLRGEGSTIVFRIVPYTEKQLMEKQREIDALVFGEDNIFSEKGITVQHTSPDIINSKVQIGITPFNDETVGIVNDYFNDDMISVVEGFEAQLLIGSVDGDLGEEDSNLAEATIDAPLLLEEQSSEGFFQRLWNWLAGLFR